MKVTVIGTGYVGLVAGAGFSETGNDVICADIDENKIAILNGGGIPIYEPGLETLVAKNTRAGRLHFTTELDATIQNALAIFIAVGTPPKEDGSADLSYVIQVAEEVADNLNGYKVIVTKSTVPAGTGTMVRRIVEDNGEILRARELEPEAAEAGDG